MFKVIRKFFSFLKILFGNDGFKALLLLIVFILCVGAIFYHYTEGWSWVDSFYFSTITLATIGYGDIYPTRDISKIFTVVYLIVGIGILITFIQVIATHTIKEWRKTLIKNTKGLNIFSNLEEDAEEKEVK